MSRLRLLALLLRRSPRLIAHLPMAVAMFAADLLARWRPRPLPVATDSQADSPGLSVIVPERGTPDLLAETLDALDRALRQVSEPQQVIVVVNGAARSDYAALQARWPQFTWQFHAQALGYNGAIQAGLAIAQYPWTYLLNSDMRLNEDALAQLLPYRDDGVFAITSQIFFVDSTRRREETGWADFHDNREFPEVYERKPDGSDLARGNLYPGGGSSLCRTAPLRHYADDSRDYSPFYWEDADWGVRAWSDGWQVLFCPRSHAYHHHRGTVKRHVASAEVDRIIARNAVLFDIRHAWTRRHPLYTLRRLITMDAQSRAELRGVGVAWRAFRSRVATQRARAAGLDFAGIASQRWFTPRERTLPPRPCVLLVTPFALFPPAHGGARRIAELVSRLADQVDFVLLSDESSLYSPASAPWLRHFRAVELIEGRGDVLGEAPLDLHQRLQRHAWPGLRRALARAIQRYRPDIVQLEFMELARLAEQRTATPRWLLALHDVYLSAKGDDVAGDTWQRACLSRFDALIACSAEDAALLAPAAVNLIGNGAIDRREKYRPSQGALLLFMGPFRYAQNLRGIRDFIDQAWPRLIAQFPDLRLRILGGSESAAIAASDSRFQQPGIEVISAFVDPVPHLAECSLTLNPQVDIRGSSIKLIESLLAGRVCVSTADGARGFSDAALPGLVTAVDIARMADAIAPLLADSDQRQRLECATPERLDAFTWDAMAQSQLALYRRLLPS